MIADGSRQCETCTNEYVLLDPKQRFCADSHCWGAKRERVVRLYLDCEVPIKQIAPQLGMAVGTVHLYLCEAGIQRRPARGGNPPHALNRRSFEALTPASLYWLGFLIADGCVTEGHRLSVNIEWKDRELLEKLRLFLMCEGNPLRREGNRADFACAAGAGMISDLFRHGITPRKSKVAMAGDEVKDSLDFWRGAIDGDGEIYIMNEKLHPKQPDSSLGTPRVCFNGSKAMCEQFTDFCAREVCRRPKVIPVSSIWRAYMNGQDAFHLLDLLYRQTNTTNLVENSLDRKRLIAERVLDRFAYRYA